MAKKKKGSSNKGGGGPPTQTMATKKKGSSNKGGGGPPSVNVTAPSTGQIIGDAAGGIKNLSGSAVSGNIAGGRASAQETLSFLQGGGGVQSSAVLSQLSDSEVKRITKEAKTTLSQKQRDERTLATVDKRLASGKLKPADKVKLEAQKANLTTRIADNQAKVIALAQEETNLGSKLTENQTTLSSALKDALGPTYAEFEKVKQQLGQQGTPGAIGQRFMDQMGQGYQAGNINWQNAAAAQAGETRLGAAPTMDAARAQFVGGPQAERMQAAQAQFVGGPQAAMAQRVADVRSRNINAPTMGNFGAARSQNISAGTVGQGQLGAALMSRALQGVRDGGRLNAEASRDATQAARQGLAARGMATGGIGMASELLNRDRYRREREMQDLQFAAGAQQQDVQRQLQNVGNQLTAKQANQSAAMQAELANLQARYNAAVQAGDWQLAAATQNQDANLRAQMANQSTRAQMSLSDQSATNQMRALGYQGSIEQNQAQAARDQAALSSNQAATNQMRALGYQGSIEQQQAQAAREQAARAANMQMSGQFSLTQGDMDQRRAMFNATQAQQNNQFNTSGQLQAAGMQQENLRLGSQLNASLLGQAAGAERMYQDRGLGASIQRMDMETQLNPTMMALGMDPFGGRTSGTQAMGPAASMANTWATNATNANMFNANAQNWAAGQQWMMNNMPSMQSGMGSTVGSIAGGLIGGAAGYFASGGNPLFALGGYAAGSQVGGGLGGLAR